MKQASLPLSLNVKKTSKAEFLEQMERVVPWAELVALIAELAGLTNIVSQTAPKVQHF